MHVDSKNRYASCARHTHCARAPNTTISLQRKRIKVSGGGSRFNVRPYRIHSASLRLHHTKTVPLLSPAATARMRRGVTTSQEEDRQGHTHMPLQFRVNKCMKDRRGRQGLAHGTTSMHSSHAVTQYPGMTHRGVHLARMHQWCIFPSPWAVSRYVPFRCRSCGTPLLLKRP